MDPIGRFRPSATYLFQSVAKVYGGRAVGVILTGMGKRWRTGFILSPQGWQPGRSLPRTEASSVVYGMPEGKAVAIGAVDLITYKRDGRKIEGTMATEK